jgi:hypothetical protein
MSTLAAARTESMTLLWKGAGLTAAAAILFPRLNAVMYEHEKIWQFDGEDRVLAPLVVVVALALFAVVGSIAWRGTRNRPALAGQVIAILAVLGVVAYWISAPIMLGGLAVTLGIEGRRRAGGGGRSGMATVAIVLGGLATAAGATLWLANI